MYKEHDIVALRKDMPEHGLCRDDIGTVVACYESTGVEVEFTEADGDTIAVLTMPVEEIRPLARREILHVRSIGKMPV